MARREIDFDEDTERILADLAGECEGDLNKTLADLVHAHACLETFAAGCEKAEGASLLAQRERAERGFDEGRFTSWEDVRRRAR